jgi:hypothetical protein
MRPLLFAMSVAIAGCSRTTDTPAHVTLSATPASPPVSASAAPARTLLPVPEWTVIGGDLVDLGAVKSARALTPDFAAAHAVSRDTAYLWVHGDVRAYDTTTGAQRWSKPESECRSMAATSRGAFCATGGGARFFRATNGDASIAGAATPTTEVLVLGTHVLVLHSNASVEALDDTNAVAGSASLPAMPEGMWGRQGLAIASPSIACGAQRSNTDTKVFCVDATPRLVWSKTSPVAGGLVQQVDGLMVIASDTWTHTNVSSEVLRTSDGATLLSIPNVRLGAALSTNGALDGALSSDPKVTLYDATGAAKWSWSQQYPSEAIHAKRAGANIVVALHSPIATGTQLLALDAATGTLAWRGDVESLPIAHSKYSNRVELDVRGPDVLLVGRESSQEFAQSFDAKSGKRIASVLRGR